MLNRVIDVALSEVGYLEKNSNSQLDNKTANAGQNNFTKYARDMSKYHAGIFANGYAWCDTFVDWCFTQALGADKALELIHGWSAYTPTSAGYYKNNGEWYIKPKKGDQIFFKDSSGAICHTGLVYNVDNTYVYTVEGNTSSASGVVANGGAVAKKQYNLNYSKIAGYGRPKYEVLKVKQEDKEVAEIVYNWTLACPEWSRPYVQKALDLGWIKGDENGQLGLTDTKIWVLVVLLRSQGIME